MCQVIPLNTSWKYSKSFQMGYVDPNFDDSSFEKVNLPHANTEVPYNYFDETMYQFISCYRKELILPDNLGHKRYILEFEGVMSYAEVYVNGSLVGEHKGGYTFFSFDITDFVKVGKNILAIMVDSTERKDIPPFGYVIDYLTFGGIYREVYLKIVDPIYIENLHVKTGNVLENKKNLKIDIHYRNTIGREKDLNISSILYDNDRIISESSQVSVINKHMGIINLSIEDLEGIELWDIDNPKLYTVRVSISGKGFEDTYKTRIGFRHAIFKTDGFYLNGRKVKIRGLNRHQSYPYVGYAMPERVQKRDADILKHELGVNLVRTSHYPQSRHFLDRCDELGLLVFEEIPGWQHIGNEDWKKVSIKNVEEMIRKDWNHPSIVLWGVRINESQDDHEFYAKTNQVARELDHTRQTGGVRCIINSEMLEDVFTFNDFILGSEERGLRDQKEVTGLKENVPYLVTEYNGHMFPTKSFDSEERRIEHAMRHIHVLNAAGLDESISGCIGWCAFDYNTHMDFGSGDRICYHGVMDMYRVPKWASYAYLSQIEPQKRVVMEPLTHWTMGDRNMAVISPVVVLTNCDYVEAKVSGKSIGLFYPSDEYKGLAHPPVFIHLKFGEWGSGWEDLELIGYLNGVPVCSKKYAKNPYLHDLYVNADDTVLHSGEIDATRIVVKLVDQYGNLLPYLNEVVSVEVDGNIEVIGPNIKSTIGGSTGFWVRTKGLNRAGKASILLKCEVLPDKVKNLIFQLK